MKQLKMIIAAFVMAATVAWFPLTPAYAFSVDDYRETDVFANISSDTTAASATLANYRIVYTGAWDDITLTVVGQGNTGYGNYSGTVYIEGSNDYAGGTPSSSNWARITTLAGDTVAKVADEDDIGGYKYLRFWYDSRAAIANGDISQINATLYSSGRK